jgi:diguanylate cyclase (GGDEF)-like protein
VKSFIHSPEMYGAFAQSLQQAIADAAAAGEQLALLVVEVDQIQRVETALGYSAGIRLANEFRSRVCGILRERDQLHQVGERKFWIIISAIKNEGHAMLAASKVRRIGQEPFSLGAHALRLEAAVGIAMFPHHAADADLLVRRADLALLNARGAELPVKVYSEESSHDITGVWQLENDLDQALDEGEFELYFQPKLELRTLRPCGAEALVRWNNPLRGLLEPGSFLSIAERAGKLERLTWYVIDAAQRLCQEWPDKWGELPVSVNVPPLLLDTGRLVEYLGDSMRIWGTHESRLILEVTEDSVFSKPEQSFAILAQLRRGGIRISIDDFGTGYSSMTYFKALPADELKIDRSFVQDLPRDKANAHIVRMVIDLAHTFGYSVVAEGVEDGETLDLLMQMGCDMAQGFGISRPVSQDQFIDWLNGYQQFRRAAS